VNRRSQTLALGLGAVVTLCGVLLLGGALAGGSSRERVGDQVRQEIKKFPLSSELPSKQFVKLQGAMEGHNRSATFLYRVHGRDRVCLVILLVGPGPGGGVSVLGGTPSCKSTNQASRRLTAALGLNDPELRLLAFIFGPDVARVELTKRYGGAKILQAKALTASERTALGIHVGFTYAVVRDQPPCFEHLKTVRANGSLAGGTDLSPC